MAATLFGSAVNNTGSGGTVLTLDLTFPASILAGDKAYIAAGNLAGSVMTVAGFTGDTVISLGTATSQLFRKVCTGTEGGTTATVTLTTTGSRIAACLFVMRGAGTPAESSTTDTTGGDVNLSSGSVVPTEDGTILIEVAAARPTNTASHSWTPPSGFTEVRDSTTTNGTGNMMSAWLGYKQLSTSTSGVTQTPGNLVSTSTSILGTVWLFAFPASGGGGSPSPSGWDEVRIFTPE